MLAVLGACECSGAAVQRGAQLRRSAACERAMIVLRVACAVAAGECGEAQTQPPKQKRPPRAKTLSFGGVWIAPSSFGTATAGLERPDGSQLVVFQADNDLGRDSASRPVWPSSCAGTSWSKSQAAGCISELRTRVSDDVESAPDTTLTESLTRFTRRGLRRCGNSATRGCTVVLRPRRRWLDARADRWRVARRGRRRRQRRHRPAVTGGATIRSARSARRVLAPSSG